MADKDSSDAGPSLELPSLFGRKKAKTRREDEPAPVEETTPVEETAVLPPLGEPEPTTVAPPVPDPPLEPLPAPAPAPVSTPEQLAPPEPVTEPAREPKPPQRPRQLPELAASTAVFVVGALVGLLGAALTFVSLQGCELVTNTDSCGGPGLLVLIAIVVVMILAGATLLKAFAVAEAGNISFLGVGLLVVVVLLFLLDHLYDAWMIAVVVALSAVSFSIAQWVSGQISEDVFEDTGPEPHDVR